MPEDPPVRRSTAAPVRRGRLGTLENLGFLFLTCLVVILGGMLVVRLAQGDTLAPLGQETGGDPALVGPDGSVTPSSVPDPSPVATLAAVLPPTIPQDSSVTPAPGSSPTPVPLPTPSPAPSPTPTPLAASTSAVVSIGGATQVDETGGEVELEFTVRNAGGAPIVVVSLVAEPTGVLAGSVDCGPGTRLAAGAQCRFSSTLSLPGGRTGTTIPVSFRAVVAPEGSGPAGTPLAPQAPGDTPQASIIPAESTQATATARLTFRDVPPFLAVTAEGPAGIPETGGTGTWAVTIRNAGSVATIVDTLTVAPLGGVPAGSCGGVVLAESETCTIQAVLTLPPAAAGSAASLTFSAAGHDAEGNVSRDAIGASLTYTDVPPHVAIRASGTESLPAAGGQASFRVTVTNDGPVQATLRGIKAGTLPGTLSGGCSTGATLAPGASCTATLAVRLPAGEPAVPASVALTATVTDREGNEATATETRTVAYAPAPTTPPTGSGTGGQTGQPGPAAPVADPADAPQEAPPATDTIDGKHVVELSAAQLAMLAAAFLLTLVGLAWWLPRRRAASALLAAGVAGPDRATGSTGLAGTRVVAHMGGRRTVRPVPTFISDFGRGLGRDNVRHGDAGTSRGLLPEQRRPGSGDPARLASDPSPGRRPPGPARTTGRPPGRQAAASWWSGGWLAGASPGLA